MAALSGVPCTFRSLDQQFVVALDGLMQASHDVLQGMSFSSELEAMWLSKAVDGDTVMLHGGLCRIV